MSSRKLDLSPAERLARTADPTLLFADAGLPEPHRHQVAALRNWRQDHMLLWSRQTGKSTTGAALATHNLLFPAGEITPTVVIVARAERQSNELFRKARQLYGALPYAPPLVTDAATAIETPTGGRILSYPGSEASVRGLSAATLALIDEATLVERELRDAVSPMLVTTGGPIWSMGTARGEEGWFFDEFTDPRLDDFVVKSFVTYRDVDHVKPDFIERERRRMPEWQFASEYECKFVASSETQLITRAAIERAVNAQEVALW